MAGVPELLFCQPAVGKQCCFDFSDGGVLFLPWFGTAFDVSLTHSLNERDGCGSNVS